MDPHLSSWLSLAVRWIHVITGIAWIGTSFYFNWLNDQMRPPARPEEGVGGEVWSVHGGGFYRVSKFTVAPGRLPERLHWFKWEAYATWLSGATLLVLIYYLQADVYLLRPGGPRVGAAIAIGVGVLVVGWFLYDALCRTPLVRHDVLFAGLGIVAVGATAFGLDHVLGSRAAYIHVGALIGTIMAANVFFVIIPSQRRMVDAMAAGREPDAARGQAAARRSRHNNYLTLPVLFIMVSNHYPMTYGHRYNWAILAGLAVVGVTARHAFNLKNMERARPWLLPAAALGLVTLALVTRPARSTTVSTVTFPEVRAIIARRCSPCHATRPIQPGFLKPPAGVIFDSAAAIRAYAQRIDALAVQTTTMPLGNLTGMTEAERETLGRWIQSGARVQ